MIDRFPPYHSGPLIDDGHQGVVDYLDNRRARERQVVQALDGRPWLTPLAIVKLVYPKLSLTLTLAAASNVDKTLRKLQADGRVQSWSPVPFRVALFGVALDRACFTKWMLVKDRDGAN